MRPRYAGRHQRNTVPRMDHRVIRGDGLAIVPGINASQKKTARMPIPLLFRFEPPSLIVRTSTVMSLDHLPRQK